MDPSSLCQCAPNRVSCPGCTALHCTCRHSWNTFCAEDMVNESNMKEMADALMSSGMVAAGYSTVNVVCNGLCRSRSHTFLRLEQPGPHRCVSIGSVCVRLHARVRVVCTCFVCVRACGLRVMSCERVGNTVPSNLTVHHPVDTVRAVRTPRVSPSPSGVGTDAQAGLAGTQSRMFCKRTECCGPMALPDLHPTFTSAGCNLGATPPRPPPTAVASRGVWGTRPSTWSSSRASGVTM
jgi:hypothetical protein